VDIGDTVAGLQRVSQRRLPAGSAQPGDVGLFKRDDDGSVPVAND
jgi:hypothetical protein